jgi:hypothetical protein
MSATDDFLGVILARVDALIGHNTSLLIRNSKDDHDKLAGKIHVLTELRSDILKDAKKWRLADGEE